MENIFLGFLIFVFIVLFFFITLAWIKYRTIKRIKRVIHRQSDNHIFLKEFFNRNTKSKLKLSQLEKRKEKLKLKVIFTEENKAYWVDNNIFYVSEIINGRPDFENAEKIDTENMSKNELDKMLFILDNLRRGDKNERGSSGN